MSWIMSQKHHMILCTLQVLSSQLSCTWCGSVLLRLTRAGTKRRVPSSRMGDKSNPCQTAFSQTPETRKLRDIQQSRDGSSAAGDQALLNFVLIIIKAEFPFLFFTKLGKSTDFSRDTLSSVKQKPKTPIVALRSAGRAHHIHE